MPDVHPFIARWKASGASEDANYHFLTELCDLLGLRYRIQLKKHRRRGIRHCLFWYRFSLGAGAIRDLRSTDHLMGQVAGFVPEEKLDYSASKMVDIEFLLL